MNVQIITGHAGPGINRNVGDVIEVSDVEGQALITAGFAKPVKETKATSKATQPTPPVETATLK